MKKMILFTFITTFAISEEITVLHIKPSKNSYILDSKIRGKIISSGEIEIEPGKTNIYTAITGEDGILSITKAANPFCQISIRNQKGKIVAIKSLLNISPQIPVKEGEIYYIYAKTTDPKQCKSFEIFIP